MVLVQIFCPFFELFSYCCILSVLYTRPLQIHICVANIFSQCVGENLEEHKFLL
jgi:hypothetical protein